MANFKSIRQGIALNELHVQGETIPEIFLKQTEKYGTSKAAIRYKSKGKWKEYSWSDYYDNVEKVAGGLINLGVEQGDKVAIISTNCPEWLFICLAAYSLGVYLVPIYPNSTPEQTKYVVEHSESKVLFVQNHEQESKTAGWRDKSTGLDKIILIFGEPSDGVMKYDALIKSGIEQQNRAPVFLKNKIDDLTPDSPAEIIYTSGTTGPPKGVILTQKNLVHATKALVTRFHTANEEDTISFLPLSHIAEQLQNVCGGIAMGSRVSFATNIETVREELTEVHPTLFLAVPRLYEKVYAGVMETVASSSFFKRFIFNRALSVGKKAGKLKNSGQKIPFMTEFQYRIAEKLVFGKMKTKLGLERTRIFFSGAAPLSAEVSEFFMSAGIDIHEIFGQTETAGICNANPYMRIVPGSVGPPLPGCETAILEDEEIGKNEEDGEILVKGDNICSGYWKNEEATKQTIKDGWLYTGDVGHFDKNGYLYITDRKKDIIVTAGGKNISPQQMENRLKMNQGIGQAVIIGDKKKYIVALLTIDEEALPKLCENLGIEKLNIESAVGNNAIREKFQEYIDKLNENFAKFEKIKYFRILPKDFTVENGDMTPTMKIKRKVVHEKYKDTIDSMYS